MFRRLTSTTTTFAYTSPFLLREAASISTVAIFFDFALPQFISFLLDFARGAKDQFSFGRDLPYFTRYFLLHWLSLLLPASLLYLFTLKYILNFYSKRKWERLIRKTNGRIVQLDITKSYSLVDLLESNR